MKIDPSAALTRLPAAAALPLTGEVGAVSLPVESFVRATPPPAQALPSSPTRPAEPAGPAQAPEVATSPTSAASPLAVAAGPLPLLEEPWLTADPSVAAMPVMSGGTPGLALSPFTQGPTGLLWHPVEEAPLPPIDRPAPALAPAPTPWIEEAPKPAEPSRPAPAVSPTAPPLDPGLLHKLHANLTQLFTGSLSPVTVWEEVKAINSLGQDAKIALLQTPQQFQAKTAELKQRLAQGASLDEVRNEAYAVARRAATVALGKTPHNSQVFGAIPLSQGRISQMNTGEGKTLTAVLPLYLNALEGKGSFLVTVNDYLAKEGFEQNKAALELLGLSTGLVLKDQEHQDKRAAYQADVTYLSNDTLGFDYLNDRMAANPHDRVQRPLHAAVVDEFDQVALDEARVPLIIAGPTNDRADAAQQYALSHDIVKQLKPGQHFEVDRENHQAYLTEVGQDMVANEVALQEAQARLQQPGADRQAIQSEIDCGLQLRQLMVREGELTEKVEDAPRLKLSQKLGQAWAHLLGRDNATPDERSLEEVRQQKQELLQKFPGVDLYADDKSYKLRYLQNALDARALFRKGRDYIVQNGEVQIVDEFKGRTSEGRRFSDGLHQALEVKEGVEVHPETRTVASITYPNLLRMFQRVSGMTGTAETSREEFKTLMGMDVVVCPSNLPSQRLDHPDRIFRTRAAKEAALTEETGKWFDQGVPVLLGSNAVESNKRISAHLQSQGIKNQPFNTENVKTSTPKENALIEQAGRSGVVTAATNMAGRGVDIKPDRVNYKGLAIAATTFLEQGQPVVVDVEKAQDAQRLGEWFNLPPEESQKVPFVLLAPGQGPDARSGTVQIRVGSPGPVPAGVTTVTAADHPGSKLVVLGTERNADQRIDAQLRGRSGRQGAPGETQFFVSLEDDLLQVYGGEKVRQLIASLDKDELSEDKSIQKLVAEAQAKVQATHAEGRFQTAQYDTIANVQRQIVWDFRDRLVNSRPDVAPVEGEKIDLPSTARDFAVQAFTESVTDHLKGKDKPNPKQLHDALQAAGQDLGFPLELPAASEGKPWRQRLQAAVEQRYEALASRLPPQDLNGYIFDLLRSQVDEKWTDQIQTLEELKPMANLQADGQRQPIDVYRDLAARAFGSPPGVEALPELVTSRDGPVDSMWKQVRRDFTRQLLPEMASVVAALTAQPEGGPR